MFRTKKLRSYEESCRSARRWHPLKYTVKRARLFSLFLLLPLAIALSVVLLFSKINTTYNSGSCKGNDSIGGKRKKETSWMKTQKFLLRFSSSSCHFNVNPSPCHNCSTTSWDWIKQLRMADVVWGPNAPGRVVFPSVTANYPLVRVNCNCWIPDLYRFAKQILASFELAVNTKLNLSYVHSTTGGSSQFSRTLHHRRNPYRRT